MPLPYSMKCFLLLVVVLFNTLPKANAVEEFPAGCEFPPEGGKKRQLTIYNAGHAPGELLAETIAYPENYKAFPSLGWLPSRSRQHGENFFILLDGNPMPWVKRHDIDGRSFQPSELPPNITFLLYHRRPMDEVLAATARFLMGSKMQYDMPETNETDTSFDGLREIALNPNNYNAQRLYYYRYGRHVTDVISCSREGAFPNCLHFFDYKALAVRATYSRALLRTWMSNKKLISRFIDCTKI